MTLDDKEQLDALLALSDERDLPCESLFSDLDAEIPQLKPVLDTWNSGKHEQARSLLADYFRNRDKPLWFYDARQGPLEKISRPPFCFTSLPPDHPQIRDELENILRHRYLAANGFVLDMGPNFEQVNPPELHPHHNASSQYNRQQFIGALCDRYATTYDPECADTAIDFVRAFLQQRPFVLAKDIGPKSYYLTHHPHDEAMSIGVRLQQWTELFYSGLAHRMDDDLLIDVIRHLFFVMVQYRRFDADHYTPGNHHLFERGVLPIFFATMYPEFRSLKSFSQTGPDVVRRHLTQAVGKDGGPNEHSVIYGNGALTLYDMADYFARLNNLQLLSSDHTRTLRKAHLFHCHSFGPDGQLIPFGDGARFGTMQELLSLPACNSSDPHLKAVMEAFGARPTLTPPMTPEEYDALEPVLPPLEAVFESTGFLFARDQWGHRANCLAMAVPHPGVYLHGHQDPLSVLAFVNGQCVLTHHGREGYPFAGSEHGKKRIERGRFYNMTTQNCLLVHGHPVKPDQAFVGGFGHPAALCTIDQTTYHGSDLHIEAHHDGYGFVRHTRRARLLSNQGVYVQDCLKPIDGANPLEYYPYPQGYLQWGGPYHIQRWHMPFSATAELIDPAAVCITLHGSRSLLIWPVEQVQVINIYPFCAVPLSSIGPDQPPPPVVDVHFGPELTAELSMLAMTAPAGDKPGTALGYMRRKLEQLNPYTCRR